MKTKTKYVSIKSTDVEVYSRDQSQIAQISYRICTLPQEFSQIDANINGPLSNVVAGLNRRCSIETTQREDCTMHIASFKWCVGDNNVVWKSVAGFHFLYFEHTS